MPMPHGWPCLLLLVPLALLAGQPQPSSDLIVTGRIHHLRSGVEREWAEFPERADGTALVVAFDAKRNDSPWTLRVRHRDLKQLWRVELNGREIAQLPYDEADMITFWTVPAGALRNGANELRIHGSRRASDDVLIGPVTLIDRPRDVVLSEAAVDVSVHDESSGKPLPARITVTDANGTLMSPGNGSAPQHAVRPGVVYTPAGYVRLNLPAGEYVIHAGRGFEYGVASVKINVARGASSEHKLTIRREVDTTGWAAMDTHVHTGTFARHGDATLEERMLTIAGEGIELPVSTEHNTRVDFRAAARDAGLREYFTPILGTEVTTPSIGHFNVFPLPPAGRAPDQNAPDWPRLRESVRAAGDDPMIVLNHGRDVHGGFRPLGGARHISVAGEDLEGWSLPANAMEIVNSGAVMTDALALPRDWMGMLNRGLMLTPVGSSDSHDVSRYIVGQARTYVRCEDGNPGSIDLSRAIDAIRRGQVMVSYGLLAEIDIEGRGPGELVRPRDALDVRIRLKGPHWTTANRVALYVNGMNVREEEIGTGTSGGVKWDARWRLPKPAHDVHVVAIATGPGISAPYWSTAKPYQPTSLDFSPYVLAVSGAVFVDADGSGAFESAFEYARREVSSTDDVQALVTRLNSYDVAVAIQAASLLRARDPAGFENQIRSAMPRAAAHVTKGFLTYLEAWNESRAAGGER